MGDPREPTAAFIREALVAGVRETMEYPRAQGLPELREAIAGWLSRRFGVEVDPERELIPTLGAKEAIFGFAQVALDPGRGKNLVVTTEPGYPVAARGARFAGAEVLQLPLLERNAFLPDLDAVGPEVWRRAALVWINYPNNPTCATCPLSLHDRLAALAAEHDFLVASDEAYSELWFDEPPVSALQAEARERVVVFNSLSKRSSMTGYRSGFVAASPEVIGTLRLYRPTVGTAPQEFVQRAAIAAWGDEEHVRDARARYGRKRELLLGALERVGLRVAGARATMYLWVEVPAGETSEGFAARLLERGVVVAPGAYLGPSGEGYVRFALVPTEEECRLAAEIMEEAL
ncbi:MAG: aminotransferase class I/II-fold pyridoxal phosphate-dependent enzyme [Thermoleophilia bacterium]|nr:aminotransferase class I/II-fold pyridoxal phosphate-dependent enzyme [Thermoleophilia bacterium]